MEISEQTIVKLISEQAATTQAVTDLKGSLDKAIPYLVAQDKINADKIDGLENKMYYFGGAGTVIGFALSHLSLKSIIGMFGGK